MLIETMNAIIITIGDELLNGQTIDTNSAYIAKALNKIGVSVVERIAIGDDVKQILDTLKMSAEKAGIIITTGGLGPTNDDITKKAIATYFGVGFKRNLETLHHVEMFFKSRNRSMLDVNREQADIPENGEIMFNKMGTAPGMYFYESGIHYFSMPGVPYEMKYLTDAEVIPRLKHMIELPVIEHFYIQTVGVGESNVAERIKEIENNLPENIKLAYLPSFGKVMLRLTGKVATEKERESLQVEMKDIQTAIAAIIKENVYSVDETPLAEVLGTLLRDKKLMLSAAESCTGGYIAHLLTSISGSSSYFHGSVVTYSYEMKVEILGVSMNILEKYGAVSEETVRAMVVGLLEKTKANIGIAVSGIAGPTGGTPDKPVGTVWIAVGNKDKINSKKYLFGKERMVNIEYSAVKAMEMCRNFVLLEYPNDHN